MERDWPEESNADERLEADRSDRDLADNIERETEPESSANDYETVDGDH